MENAATQLALGTGGAAMYPAAYQADTMPLLKTQALAQQQHAIAAQQQQMQVRGGAARGRGGGKREGGGGAATSALGRSMKRVKEVLGCIR